MKLLVLAAFSACLLACGTATYGLGRIAVTPFGEGGACVVTTVEEAEVQKACVRKLDGAVKLPPPLCERCTGPAQ